ncbi:MAG: response regulator [Ignavibacteria bacterium]|nr:response regulator [Ignavibacteria bacterium]
MARGAPHAADAALRTSPAGTKRPPAREDGGVVNTLLLVEDNESAVIQMKDILEDSGYQLLVARGGEEALGIIERTIPDAIVLDLMMPGIDGFEVLGTLREAERTARPAILTAKQITADELKFLSRNNVHQLIQKGDINPRALDACDTSGRVPRSSSPRASDRPGATPVVLVVEDNADNMLTVKALLGDEYAVIEAVDGRASVALATRHKPDLILLDPELPGMRPDVRRAAGDAQLRCAHRQRPASERDFLALGFDAYTAETDR